MTMPYLFHRRETDYNTQWPGLQCCGTISRMTFLHEEFTEEVEVRPSAVKCFILLYPLDHEQGSGSGLLMHDEMNSR